jgi:hypothetical protein
MLNLLNLNHEKLGLEGGAKNFDVTIQETKTMLTQNTIILDIYEVSRTNDSIFIEVSLKNKAGHKFPTGFPSRRAYLEFLVMANSDTLFHSGNKNAAALNHTDDEEFEPHYKKITRENQVQIFEFVMGDSEGEVTTILERAYEPLKDNRIPPEGFSQSHTNYDTVRVVGSATTDTDYLNGSGTEKIIYAFPLSILEASAYVKAILHYETAPESWLNDLFEYSEEDEDIDNFKTMYHQIQRKSEIVAKDSIYLATTDVKDFDNKSFRIYPNPTSGKIRLQGINEDFTYSIFSSDGVRVKSGKMLTVAQELTLNLPPGNYVFVAECKSEPYKTNLVIMK